MLAPVAVTVIVPSFVPQPVGLAEATVLITGATGCINITSASVTIHVPSIFLTAIWYVPPGQPLNISPCCHVVPPLMEYNNAPVPLAVIWIAPLKTPQSEGLVPTTAVITGATGATNVTVG